MKHLIKFILMIAVAQMSAQNLNYYFGNLHSHTGFSDGCKDSTQSGVTNPQGAFAFAKLSQHFDFLGISEHNHYSSNKNPGFKLPLYQVGLNMADSANKNPNFLALFGMEWGVSSTYYGHVVIYGFNQLIGWENSVPNVSGNNYNIYNAKADYDGLFRKIKNNPNAFCYLAHPYNDDYTLNGDPATALANAPYNATYDSAIVGVPLRNGVAFSTNTSYNDYPQSDYYNYYKKLLSIGYHVGVGYDHDNHNTTFGRNNGGRLVIMAPSLTRANLTQAMKKMNFYGSDDWNAKINFSMNGNNMGAILSGSTEPTFNLVHNDPDGEQANVIKIWRGISNGGGIFPTVVYTANGNNTATYTDHDLIKDVEYFYFAEITQADGNWIVTSPIWFKSTVDLGNPVSVSENQNPNKMHYNYYWNQINKTLDISFDQNISHTITMMDISGRKIFCNVNAEDQQRFELSSVNPGVYILIIHEGNKSEVKKMIIE